MKEKTNKLCPPEQCTGCEACANVCAHDAIAMQADELGFLRPVIDADRCVNCGRCTQICPPLQPVALRRPVEVLAAYSKDADERRTSASGGAASVLGRVTLQSGGVVYGCCQTSCADIGHIRVDRPEDLARLKGSKYVQSRIGRTLRDVRADLKRGVPVLFTGTPCQVAGLRRFLGKDYANLTAVDLICHGVPSPRMLCDDIVALTGDGKDLRDVRVDFRWKTRSAIRYGIQVRRSGKVVRRKAFPYDPYITAFMTSLAFREGCHRCPYSRFERTGDLTLGDFWGLGALAPTQFRIRDGVSLILVNTPAGQQLWQQAQDRFVYEPRQAEEAIRGNANLRRPSPRPRGKATFNRTYRETGRLDRAVRAAVSRPRWVAMALTEELKQVRPLVSAFKKARLLLNKKR